MTWGRVLLFAAAVGIYTGVVMLIPFLDETSFQDIGVAYEWWVVFAVIIVVNCKKSWEAMLKCFVFFLVSQPVIYLVQIVFGSLSFADAWGYYLNFWLPMTVLTLPGGFIAYFCKKQNIGGAVVLGLGNTIEAVMAVTYFVMAMRKFPHHLLSGLVSVAAIVIMSFYIQKSNKRRAIALGLPIVLTAVVLVVLRLTGRVII